MRLALLGVVALVLGLAVSDDSLKGALEAVHRRQRDLASNIYFPRVMGDGQPEDIGYGFQKTMAPNTAGVFDPVALPSWELGAQDERDAETRALERLMLEYLEEADDNVVRGAKRSVFRERGDLPEALQRLYQEDKEDEELPFLASMFRERATDGGQKARLQNAHSLLRNYAGLVRGYEDSSDESEDDDEYLGFLNALLDKYRGEEDREEPTDADVEEILDYLGRKEDKKRQYGGSYAQGYDFFNSPLAWYKRSSKRDDGDDVGRLVLTAGYDDRYSPVRKRYPIAKRSLSHYSGLHHSGDMERKKKNAPGNDPKVAEELNDIFDATTPRSLNASKNTSHHQSANVSKQQGQKETAADQPSLKPLEMRKKSIDWSEYFGMDRRRKKSSNDWLLDQYAKAYGLGKQKVKGTEEKRQPDDMDSKLRAMEDLIVDQAIKYTGAHEGISDAREAQEVKDQVISQLAAAYSLEKMRRALGEFKSSIAAQKLSAPASHSIPPPKIERLDDKSKRIAVKKEKADVAPAEGRVEKKDSTREISNMIKDSDRDFEREEMLDCPILQEMESRCERIGEMAGDKEELFTPLCIIHQICYLCGAELGRSTPRGCDAGFLWEADGECDGEAGCLEAGRRVLASLRRAAGAGGTCHPRARPCLAQFLASASRRRR